MAIKVTVVTNQNRFPAELVSENSTIRGILEEKGVNYGAAVTSVNGRSLRANELDQTLTDLGVVSDCFISSVVKADNAVSAAINGSACVITTTLKREDLVTAKKYRPKTLVHYEGEGAEKDVVFGLDVDESAGGNINKYSATFGKPTTADGCATITLMLGANIADAKKTIEESFGGALLQIKKFEEELGAVMEDINAEKAEIASHITVA